MKASELRIGNWAYQGNQYGNMQANAYQIYNYSLYQEGAKDVSEYYEAWKPIPLDESWLERFGLKKWNTRYTKKGVLIYWSVKEGCYCYGKATTRTRLKYVHQLQNLYFALTGEEL